MSKLLTNEVANRVRQELQRLHEPVKLVFFTQTDACGACADQHDLLKEITSLSDKLLLEVHDLNSRAAIEYGISQVPATAVCAAKDYGIRFYGLTGGYEFGSLLESIQLVSQGVSALDPVVATLALSIKVPTHLEVMVTLACPYCPKMVRLAHQLAVANELVHADMVDASEFPQIVNRYDVHGVPLTIINGRRGFEGALPAEQAILEILRVADPDSYEDISSHLRDAQGLRHIRDVTVKEIYDVIVVGAGPAGLTAALYSQRKGRKTALIGKKIGGQISDTALVENYPGVIQVSGTDLAQAMRQHLEAYPVAERCRTQVESIEREGDRFRVRTDDQQEYHGRTVIFCAGKRYRRLNVPGEERFIGRGIAWCATCDAPLCQGKRVAVVGGGNSAFTAVRDLLRYASEIHIIYISENFNADPVLVGEVKRPENEGRVHFHLNSQVREYLGGDRLQGVRIASVGGEALYDLAVEGVFLEIGLEPNSLSVAHLLELNERGEVPVSRDQSTVIPGLFAAGDVTDEIDKQIVVAAGAGAKAALAADRYLALLTDLPKVGEI